MACHPSPPTRATLRIKADGTVASDLPDHIPVTDREIDLILALLGERIGEILSAP